MPYLNTTPEAFLVGIVACLYLGWFIICIIHQLPNHWVRRLALYDLLGLLPNWRFFAPKPFSADYHLVVRLFDEERRAPECIEITDVLPIASRPLCALWNPDKRVHFGYIDAVIDLLNRAKLQSAVEVQRSAPYRTIANFVAAYLPHKGVQVVQFIVVATDGYRQREDPIVVFVSERLTDAHLRPN
jgi:hypothetical protein